MKPKTKIQKEVAELYPQLPPLTQSQIEYARANCHHHVGFVSGNKVWCVNCQQVSEPEIHHSKDKFEKEYCICPHCGKRLDINRKAKRIYREEVFYTVLTTFRGWQVIRHFIVKTESFRNKPYDRSCEIYEVVQIWINSKGNSIIVAKPTVYNYFAYCLTWKFDADFEIRSSRRKNHYYGDNKYEIWSEFIYPDSKVLPIVRRNGFSKKIADNVMPPCKLIKLLLTDSETEYLIKTKQYELARYFKYQRDKSIKSYLPAIKTCFRHGYKIKDVSMWVDYVDSLIELGFDIANPHYACPVNLNASHDLMLKKKQKKHEIEKLKKLKIEAEEFEAEYQKTKAPFFGICFGNENVVITVIQSVADMAEEGSALHHCVYANKYFKRAESLILSAKDHAGNRIETIELSLKTFEVVQSRGLMNQNSKFHKEILDLVKSNIQLFKKAA